MNKLSIEKRAQIISALVEGNSIRSITRMTGASKNTVSRLLRDVGLACIKYQNEHLKNLNCKRIECDEIWSFCYAKQKNLSPEKQGQFGYGDVWTFTAIDADTKLISAWLVGLRNVDCAKEFVLELKNKITSRIQISTDGHKMYLEAVENAFAGEIDFGQLVKLYGTEPETEKRYSPAHCIGAEKHIIQGDPDTSKISTSYVERQNLTMRMGMRRFTRLTNAFSKKIEFLEYSVALHFMYYNFARPHKTLANPYPRTPAMAAGLENRMWTIEDIVRLVR